MIPNYQESSKVNFGKVLERRRKEDSLRFHLGTRSKTTKKIKYIKLFFRWYFSHQINSWKNTRKEQSFLIPNFNGFLCEGSEQDKHLRRRALTFMSILIEPICLVCCLWFQQIRFSFQNWVKLNLLNLGLCCRPMWFLTFWLL